MNGEATQRRDEPAERKEKHHTQNILTIVKFMKNIYIISVELLLCVFERFGLLLARLLLPRSPSAVVARVAPTSCEHYS